MRDHSGMIRGFYHQNEAYYAAASSRSADYVDEVMIGFYGENGDQGTTGEFAMRWTALGGKTTPQLMVYDDAWDALSHFADLLAEMSKIDGENIEPGNFCLLLKSLDMKDLTPRTPPYGMNAIARYHHHTAMALCEHHKRTCDGPTCNISLGSIREMAEAAGAVFTEAERKEFM